MRCRACGAEEEEPNIYPYRFYYGTSLGTEFHHGRASLGTSATYARYRIAGSEDGSICWRCVALHAIERRERQGLFLRATCWFGFAASVIAFFVTVGERDSGGLPWLLLLAGLLCLGAPMLFSRDVRRACERLEGGDKQKLDSWFTGARQRSHLADSAAIARRRTQQDMSVYDAFFTPEEYGRLESAPSDDGWVLRLRR